MGRVIAVANQKGGVGKTTTVLNLGAGLAELGQRVLLIDMDPQAALTAIAGLDPYQLEKSTNTLLTADQTPMQEILHPISDHMWLVPASVKLAAAEYVLAKRDDHLFRLRRALESARKSIDFVLIDTPPSLGLLTINALAAADEMLVPVGCQYLAMRGIRALLETVRHLRVRHHPDLKLLGFVITLHQPDSDYCRQVVRELRAAFKDRVLDTVIVVDEAVAVAPVTRQSVLSFRSNSPAAGDYRRLAREVMTTEAV